MTEQIVMILGARSDIGTAVAHRFAKDGYSIQLAARNHENLFSLQSDIQLRYKVPVTVHEFDALDFSSHEGFVRSLPQLPSTVICAVGYMGEQLESQLKVEFSVSVMRSNYEGPATILAVFANHFEKRGFGCLVGISSVAGDRGRATNYIYGSAKAGFTAFLSGLRNRLSKKGVHVVTVLPGFVHTKMTENMKLPTLLTSRPIDVANAIFFATKKKKNIIYIGKIWLLIMYLIRQLPEQVFKKVNF